MQAGRCQQGVGQAGCEAQAPVKGPSGASATCISLETSRRPLLCSSPAWVRVPLPRGHWHRCTPHTIECLLLSSVSSLAAWA